MTYSNTPGIFGVTVSKLLTKKGVKGESGYVFINNIVV